ncbi:calvin cycle protein CP12-1, chloroplastic-like [Silene latifolia]|uniref:calvin cycle protein CP12-1, chloroplastic-like n=1 Tax=Silene latifolia TaxID=37657 RepID=UPI003D76AB31
MATLNVSMSPKVVLASKPAWREYETPRLANTVTYVRKGSFNVRRGLVTVVRASPDKLSESIEQSIKAAQETCADNPETGECAAAWDEVEEVSAAASHARDKSKDTDPLETYCKDNPETDECRTYDN